MYSGRSWWWEGGEPKARYIQENAKTLNGGPVYPTIVEVAGVKEEGCYKV
jgi:hypothetical protein